MSSTPRTCLGHQCKARFAGIGRVLAIVLALLPALASQAVASDADEPWTLPVLMAAFREAGSAEALFREEKSASVLEVPLSLSGELSYRAPDYLRKTVLQPAQETYEISGDQVVISAPGQPPRTLSLDEYPLLRAFVASFRATLGGDLATLRRHYEHELSGGHGDWSLTLVPKDAALASYVESVCIKGREARILSVETLERGGDSSVLILSPRAPTQPLE